MEDYPWTGKSLLANQKYGMTQEKWTLLKWELRNSPAKIESTGSEPVKTFDFCCTTCATYLKRPSWWWLRNFSRTGRIKSPECYKVLCTDFNRAPAHTPRFGSAIDAVFMVRILKNTDVLDRMLQWITYDLFDDNQCLFRCVLFRWCSRSWMLRRQCNSETWNEPVKSFQGLHTPWG